MTKITGNVQDLNGEPIVGAHVTAYDENEQPLAAPQGGHVTTYTDDNGDFELNIPETTAYVIASYVGFGSQGIPADAADYNFRLKEGNELNEVEITAKRPGKSSLKDWQRYLIMGGALLVGLVIIYIIYKYATKRKAI